MTRARQPEYVAWFLAHRRDLTVVIEPHARESRVSRAPVTSRQLHQLVETGLVQVDDCLELPDRPYDKYGVTLYFPDDSRTLKAILTVNWTTWVCQVETVWAYPGRTTRGRRPRSVRRKR